MSGIPGESMSAAAAVDALLAAVETEEEGEILRDLLVRTDLIKECTKCDEVHRQAGQLCISCQSASNREAPLSDDTRWSLAFGEAGVGDVHTWALRIGEGSAALVQAINVTLDPEDLGGAQKWAAGLLAKKLELIIVDWAPKAAEAGAEPDQWIAVMQTD
ncbi:hypothetical protein [Streptomyces sp. WAC 06738]|uniref:hypothetical protein n=1 Tax=Streptomyces sp. WAC 06738 TaxID=2203210 RepID=UPI000F79AF17|nr:hypothetical protein [Streptomyces sp. WAC 06738]